MEVAVFCHGLTKRYGDVVAVDDIDLSVPVGECFGLLGPNGAGKTTTVEILQGIRNPDEGEVRVFGFGWRSHEAELRQRMGSQLQESKLPEKLTVAEAIRLFRSFYRTGLDVDRMLRMVQLVEKRDSQVSQLSGGQQQRLSVACALVGEPDLLFLDEPTTGLDPQSRHQLWSIVEDFKSRGGTAVLTTHYMEEAEQLCERVGVMDHGRFIALGTPRELISSLGAEQVVEFALEGSDVGVNDQLYLALPGVEGVARENGRVRLTVREIHSTVPALLEALNRAGQALSDLTTHHATLEDVFISLTGRHLRDG